MLNLLQDYCPMYKLHPPVAVKVVVSPVQMETSMPALIGALPETVTLEIAVFTQPLASVPVTVYEISAVGVVVTVAPVVVFNSVPGDHE